MKKFVSVLLIFCLAFSSLLFGGCKNKTPEVEEEKNVNIVAFGDSISAGYAPQNTEMYAYYNDYVIGRARVNEKCFTGVLANSLSTEEVSVKTVSYAESGDTTDDLIDKFNDSQTYPDLLSDISSADIITLCIGANNVLSPTIDNMSALLAGSMSLEDFEDLLMEGYNNFKFDYTNSIIPVLTRSEAQIYVMTVYDPYKYASLLDITVTGSIGFDFSAFETQFSQVKSLAIEYLEKINEYIRTQRFDNVFVVDVYASFETISKAEYGNFVNVDTTEISLEVNNYYDLLTIQSKLIESVYLDPHPTMFGQQFIASLFYNAIIQNNSN